MALQGGDWKRRAAGCLHAAAMRMCVCEGGGRRGVAEICGLII